MVVVFPTWTQFTLSPTWNCRRTIGVEEKLALLSFAVALSSWALVSKRPEVKRRLWHKWNRRPHNPARTRRLRKLTLSLEPGERKVQRIASGRMSWSELWASRPRVVRRIRGRLPVRSNTEIRRPRIARRRGQELIRCAVDPTPLPGYIGHHLKGNSPALVLGQHETLRVLGVLDRLQ